MMMIEIIDTGLRLTETQFYTRHPTISFPAPLTDAVLAPFGARLVVGEQEVTALRQSLRAAVNAWRDAQESGAVQFYFETHLWDGSLAARARLQQVLSCGEVPPGFFWTSATDDDVPMSYAALQALDGAMVSALVAQGWQIHRRQREMKAEIDALPGDRLATYVIGWPGAEDGDV